MILGARHRQIEKPAFFLDFCRGAGAEVRWNAAVDDVEHEDRFPFLALFSQMSSGWRGTANRVMNPGAVQSQKSCPPGIGIGGQRDPDIRRCLLKAGKETPAGLTSVFIEAMSGADRQHGLSFAAKLFTLCTG